MKYRELIILLPCQSLEDFPLHHKGEAAAGLLAGWSALWHPALLAAAGAAPTWCRAEDPSGDLVDRLVVIPSVSETELPGDFAERAEEEGARLIRGQHERGVIVDAALAGLDAAAVVEEDLAADFLALGYCRLQVELLTRQMRYSSNLDEVHFQTQAVDAALAAASGDAAKAREKLGSCFDLLAEERDHYYPVDAYVLDLTLVGPHTIGQSLRDELAGLAPVSLLLSGEVLRRIAEREPDTLRGLKEGIEQGRVGLVGGEAVERCLPLLSCETILGEIRRGLALYEALATKPVRVFGRRRSGLMPALPQILHKFGFQGAIHAALEGGRVPNGSQVKIRWEGADGATIDAMARAPLDASRPETFLGLAGKMGESMDVDHVATLCLAHWPGQTSVGHDDLRRISKYGSALGKLVAADEYFRDTDLPSQLDRFKADQYRSPYLAQIVKNGQADPISSVVRYWRRRSKAESLQTLNSLASMITGAAGALEVDALEEVDRTAEDAEVAGIDQRLDEALSAAVDRFAASLPRGGGEAQPGYLVVNPHSFTRRLRAEKLQLEQLPDRGRAVYAAGRCGEANHAVVDAPPTGFVWVTAGGQPDPRKRPEQSLADECLLQNEFLEARINPDTGSLQSVHSYETRGNRLSQQLAFRFPTSPGGRRSRRDAESPAGYSVMAADSIEVTASSTVVGEIASSGRLVNRAGETVAGYRQKYRLWLGSRVLELEIELEPHAAPGPDPWQSYYACRFAWANETADLWRSVNQGRQAAGVKRLEAPLYLEIDDAQTRTAILTGGLPFHCRRGRRMLDSLLIVRGERARKFRIGIGVDLRNPMQEALGLLTPPTHVRQNSRPPAPSISGWLFHVDARNVIATYWAPLVREGRVEGVRVRLLETSGRSVRAKFACFRKISSARQVDFRGHSLGQCRIEDGVVCLEFSAHEWVELEACW